MATRFGFVVKIGHFSPQNGDEIQARRQKKEFLAQKRRRERVSSLKKGVSRAKTTTRKSLVAKNEQFSPQNGDEKESRRQKKEFLGSK
ncbi:hypothetical protein QPM05_18265 [Caldibacillus thermoamylovorans]|nr:hypothetical protein [Caldibacillus thermoamylovorans]